jgi:hypothetical protein
MLISIAFLYVERIRSKKWQNGNLLAATYAVSIKISGEPVKSRNGK